MANTVASQITSQEQCIGEKRLPFYCVIVLTVWSKTYYDQMTYHHPHNSCEIFFKKNRLSAHTWFIWYCLSEYCWIMLLLRRWLWVISTWGNTITRQTWNNTPQYQPHRYLAKSCVSSIKQFYKTIFWSPLFGLCPFLLVRNQMTSRVYV